MHSSTTENKKELKQLEFIFAPTPTPLSSRPHHFTQFLTSENKKRNIFVLHNLLDDEAEAQKSF